MEDWKANMKILKKCYYILLYILPAKLANYIIFFKGYKKILNLKNPQYFGEKIQWLKLYGGLENLSSYVDKYEVRAYVAKTIGERYLNDLYGVYENPEQIDFCALPQQFVLKSTNGSATLLICKDKNCFDIEKAKYSMNRWLRQKYYRYRKEVQYKNIKNRIMIEKYLEDDSGELRDYKFYCYDGKARCYGIFSNRFSSETVDIYDMSGRKLDVTNGGMPRSSIMHEQSADFNELVTLVECLAKPFQFVRVDFYIVNGQFIFGELTFTDGAGGDAFLPLDFDKEMAKDIRLEKIDINL